MQNALYEPKNSLKLNLTTFYGITTARKFLFLVFSRLIFIFFFSRFSFFWKRRCEPYGFSPSFPPSPSIHLTAFTRYFARFLHFKIERFKSVFLPITYNKIVSFSIFTPNFKKYTSLLILLYYTILLLSNYIQIINLFTYLLIYLFTEDVH